MRHIEINKEWNDRQPFTGISYFKEESSSFLHITDAYIKHREWLSQFDVTPKEQDYQSLQFGEVKLSDYIKKYEQE